MIRSTEVLIPWTVNTPGASAHTVPTGRVAFFGRIPGNKLPGYDHPVPPGQKSDASVRDNKLSLPVNLFESRRHFA
jgi:hypothetical protein